MTRTARWLFVAALLPIAACSNTTPPVAAAPPAPPPVAAVDQTFINTAAASDAGEIQAAQIAATKAHSPRVKQFAQHMVTDHTQTTQQLTQIAQAKGVTPDATLPQPVQDSLAKLQSTSAGTFDRAYLRQQIQSHQQAVQAFQAEAANGVDPDLKQFATSTLPTIQQHLAMARRLAGLHA